VESGWGLLGAVLLACALTGLCAAPASATPTILLLHGGGFQTGAAADMRPWQVEFEADGYRTISVEYPRGRVTPAIDYAEALARRERLRTKPVIAYGVSAGGTIAAALAAKGVVDGAVNVLGPTDFTRWGTLLGAYYMLAARMSSAEKRSDSPLWMLAGQQTPQLLQCGRLDYITPWDQCRSYVRRAATANPDTSLQPMLNTHDQSAADRAKARAWVQAHWPAR
jgi:acetyl esterase/lipase